MKDMTQDQSLYSIEAEQALLGAVLLDNRAYHRCGDIVTKEVFFDPVHGRIWEICAGRIQAGELASPVILASMMAAEQGLNELGGAKYLVRIAGATPANATVALDYARHLHELWQRRTVLAALEEAQIGIRDGGAPSTALNVVMAVSEVMRGSDGKPASISFLGALAEVVKEMTAPDEDDDGGLLLGLKEWDRLVGRLRRGDAIILGGRPSMGKTSLALSAATMVADKGVGVAIVSLEMTGGSLAYRALGEASGVAYERIIERRMSDDEMRKVLVAANDMQSRPVEIVQPHIKDLHAINAALVRIKHQFEARGTSLGLVLIDYLQLIRAPGKDAQAQVSAASKGVKALAMQLDVPVIALSQLSRAVESRDNKRPILSDLRESGSIEQDADLVIFCYRDEYYLEREKPQPGGSKDKEAGALADWEASMSAARNKMEIILAKKRMGRIGAATIGFDAATNRVWSLIDDRGAEVQF